MLKKLMTRNEYYKSFPEKDSAIYNYVASRQNAHLENLFSEIADTIYKNVISELEKVTEKEMSKNIKEKYGNRKY